MLKMKPSKVIKQWEVGNDRISQTLDYPAYHEMKTITDSIHREFGIVLVPNVPVRIHAPNGGYLFSVMSSKDGYTYTFEDKKFGSRNSKAKRVL